MTHNRRHAIRVCPHLYHRPEPALQLDALNKAGCEKIFKDEGITGSTTKRPGLKRCLKSLEEGDRLTVWKLDRLARSLRDLVVMIEDFNQRGIEFRSLTEEINTTTPGGKLVFHIFAALAEFERGLIIERTREGMKAAKARGIRAGRKPKLTSQQIEHAKRLIEEGQYHWQVADLFAVSRQTLYRTLERQRDSQATFRLRPSMTAQLV
jgi:DNA invertase Pin-like site-specific DNA recombinase